MNKLHKSLSFALCAALMFSMFFSEFTLGYSSSVNDKDNKEKIVRCDDEVEYTFKFLEFFSHWFD